MTKPWKRSATIILLAKTHFSNSVPKVNGSKTRLKPSLDYRTLVVKRAEKSSFMPSGVVFPGGLHDDADSSRDWLELYQSIGGIGSSLLTYPFKSVDESDDKHVRINNVLTHSQNDNRLTDSLTLRITAIRELFEECGLLLAKNADSVSRKNELNYEWASFLHSDDILHWRERVQRNPNEFLALCKQFTCVPDVWSLKDWSFWLTPVHLPTKRFDTAFFVAALNQIPPTVIDNKEVSDLKWVTPSDLIEEYRARKIWLPPPQFYELSRIVNNFHKLKDFVDYSGAWYGCARWMPVGVKASDGWVFLLPGDEMYPEEPNFLNSSMKTEETELKMVDLRDKCSRMHRMEIADIHNVCIIMNCLPTADHVYPKLTGI